MEAAIKFVGLLFLVSFTFVAADYSSILSSLYQKANQNKRPLILVLDKTNDDSKTSKRLLVANRDNNNNNRYPDNENQRYRETNSRPYNEYIIDNRNTDYRSSSNSRNRDLNNNRNEMRNDRIKGSNDVRQSSYDVNRNSYRSVNRNHVARLFNRQSPKRHSSVRVSDRNSNRYQRSRSSHELHHDHINYYGHSDPNHYYVHDSKHDNDIHYHNGEHSYHNPNEVYYKVYEPAHVHHYVDSHEKKYYGPQVVSVSQSHEGHSYRVHNAHEHYPLRDVKSSKLHNRSPNADQNRYNSQSQSNVRHGYDKDSTRAKSKKYLRSSVVKSLLRVANDIQCEALNECEDECATEKKNDCEDECQENFECQEEQQLDKCEKDECAESTENDNPSTRGVVEEDVEDNCNNCKFDK